MPPPIPTPRITSSQARPSAGGWLARVVATAIAMPAMPSRLPRRLEAGLDRPRSDRMNRTPATRYRTADTLAFIRESSPLSSSAPADDPVTKNNRDQAIDHRVLDASPARGMTTQASLPSVALFLVHPEHALGDQEAAEDVHAGKNQRNEAETARPTRAAGEEADAEREQRADHDHRGDRVRDRHQRRVQRSGHRPHHEVTDR